MPVHCPFPIEPLTTEEFRELDYQVMRLRDWGTSLTLSLYLEALVSLLGGKDHVEVMLPLSRDGVCLGNQRFHLADSKSAFKLTALIQDTVAYEAHFVRLLHHSPLKAFHWVNIEHETVTLKTVSR